jgi:8-oxo-dGTP pyrophosphatase MutT (NUDIX family)
VELQAWLEGALISAGYSSANQFLSRNTRFDKNMVYAVLNAERETHEETGITVKVTGLLGIFSDPGHVVLYHSNGETRQEYEIIFLGEPVSGDPAANDGASAAGWYTRGELPGLDIHPSQRRQLGHWMNGTYPHYD